MKLTPIALALMSSFALAACTPTIKSNSPPISVLGSKKAPDEDVLPIIKSEPIAVDAKRAADNYREILKLAPDEDTRREAARRLADLQVQIQDSTGDTEESESSLRDSISLYKGLLKKTPDDEQNDRIYYQLARAYQNIGETDAAIDTLQQLTTKHASSEFAGDAHFRRAELLFYRERYEEAEVEYKTVMDLADATPFFEPSQYKFGWSRYKQSNYEGALEVFIAILDRELPKTEIYETKAAIDGVAKDKTDLAKDALRVTSLSFIALGGGPAVNDYLTKKGDPRFYPLLYTALGEHLLSRRRYTDAAESYAAFIGRYPQHAHAPEFQSRVIGAYAEGGFSSLVVREKERYATVYDPAAAYWAGKPVRGDVLKELRIHFEDLGRHYYALGLEAPATPAVASDAAPADSPFLTAARWYQRILEVFPEDIAKPEMNFMLGESLFNGGKTLEAAAEYMKTAYGYPLHGKAADSGYAAVLAYQKNAREVAAEKRNDALRLSIDASVKLADKFPAHPEVYPVLTRSTEDLYELKDYEGAIKVAARVIKAPVSVDFQLRRTSWSITADSQFALKRYAAAEQAYLEELKLMPKSSPAVVETTEQLAAAIYKQGEAARDSGNLRAAAGQFLRVGTMTPNAKIRSTAEYDGATMLMQLEDWPAAQRVLENFRGLFPAHALEADVDKKLAVAYQKDAKPLQAAQAYGRIAQRSTEPADIRMEAAWVSANLYDEAKSTNEAALAYEYYVANFNRPLQRALDASQRLSDISKGRNDSGRHLFWLRQIIALDESAGADRTERSKSMGANAAIMVGRMTAEDMKAIRLTAPVDKSLPRKKQAMEAAIQALSKAANYGYAEITTAATYELGALYADFAKSLTESERPSKLDELALEQYNLLLEEQADPFVQQAVKTYEINLKRIPQGIYDPWVAKSAKALAVLSPAKYGKREKGEDFYATLK